MLRGSQSIWAVILLLAPLVVSAQDQGQVFNVTRVFNLAGTVYNQGGSLLPVSSHPMLSLFILGKHRRGLPNFCTWVVTQMKP